MPARTESNLCDPDLFPVLPAYTVTGAAMFLEPIAGSGERLCVAVAARGEDGRWQIAQVLDDDLARRMVGEHGERLSECARRGVTSLKQHLDAGEPLHSWCAPFGGLTLGPTARGQVADLPMMLRALARNHAFLASPAGRRADTAIEDGMPAEEDAATWLRQVRQAVFARDPLLDAAFARRITLVENGIQTRFDFVSDHFAAQLGRLLPGSTLSHHMRVAKAKLWDLQALRDSGRGPGLPGSAHYALLLYRPAENDALYSDRSLAQLHAAVAELTAAGARGGLCVRACSSAEELAEEILAAASRA
jgi:hypothetical protein